MKGKKDIDKQKFIKSERSECFFSFNKKIIPILKLEIKVGESNQKVDVGEVLHEMANIYLSKTSYQKK